MTLADCKDGQNLLIMGSSQNEINLQAIRFGINQGSTVKVAKNITNGPVIILKNQLEIAIGRQLAKVIQVQIIE